MEDLDDGLGDEDPIVDDLSRGSSVITSGV